MRIEPRIKFFAFLFHIAVIYLSKTSFPYHFQNFISVTYVVVGYCDVRRLAVVISVIVASSYHSGSFLRSGAGEIDLGEAEHLVMFKRG